MQITRRQQIHLGLLGLYIVFFIWSGIRPVDPKEWLAEVAPLTLAVAIIVATYRQFTFTTASYIMMFLFALLLLIGAHYTYNVVPGFNEFKELIHSRRNDFDRLVHLFQGATPIVMTREILIRAGVVRKKWWLFFISLSIVMALSAIFELCEWFLTITTGYDIIGGQGEPFDTQIDMLMALVGGSVTMLLLRPYYNKILRSYGKF